MRQRIHRSTTLGRLALMLGSLAFLTGTVLEPLVHPLAPAVQAESPLAGTNGEDTGEGSTIPHDELGCAVCQVLGATVVLPSSAFSALNFRLQPAVEPQQVFSPRLFRISAPQSRAPPLV